MILAPPVGRSFLIAGLVVLGLTACGRRGPLEPPPDPASVAAEQRRAAAARQPGSRPGSAPSGEALRAVEGQANEPGQAQVADFGPSDDPGTAESLSPVAAPSGARRRRTPYVIPKEPFVLDPLL